MTGAAALTLRWLFRLLSGERQDEQAREAVVAERRKPPYRCAGCHVWTPNLIFLRNGGSYCLDCARNLGGIYGTRPAGKRAGAVTDLTVSTGSRPGSY